MTGLKLIAVVLLVGAISPTQVTAGGGDGGLLGGVSRRTSLRTDSTDNTTYQLLLGPSRPRRCKALARSRDICDYLSTRRSVVV
ncbi:hypothetical protein EVAR_13850_1 [Eumeta japonica]|uniref:Secreted protein n=1 Tax=Eumeta variegata TaxID=151549 RepID=A0A4C1U1G9_EUMVA|nr:hypothetical protein EVAR_13850_1 [Eumeta japonica]